MRSRTVTISTWAEIAGAEVDIEAECELYPAEKDVGIMSPYAEIVEVRVGAEVVAEDALRPCDRERILDAAAEQAIEDAIDRYAAAIDDAGDAERDRRMGL